MTEDSDNPTGKFNDESELPAINEALNKAAKQYRANRERAEQSGSKSTKTSALVSDRGAAASTVEAVMYELRTYGVAALAGPNCRRRLGELTEAQLGEVIERLIAMRTRYPAITDELLFQLGEQLS
jgi:hypothetical protein